MSFLSAREANAWVLHKLDLGKRRRMEEIAIPSDLEDTELATTSMMSITSWRDQANASNRCREQLGPASHRIPSELQDLPCLTALRGFAPDF